MNQENKKLVIFDFDGVLADTLIASYDVFKKVNENVNLNEFKSLYEENLHESLKTKKLISRPDYFSQYDKHTREIKVPDILKKIVKELSFKYILAIVSSTQTSSIEKILEREELLTYFNDILGYDFASNKVEKINIVLKKYEISQGNVVYITDTLGDIREAQKCGVKSIAVTWGFHSRETLEKGSPVAIIDDPNDLLNTVNNVLK
jgi:phosphoglycolate phosphatase